MEQALAEILEADPETTTSSTPVACLPVFARGKLTTTWLTVAQCVALIRTAVERDYDHEYCINPVGLPYTKLYFDIDCLECKRAERGGDGGKRCAAAASAAAAAAETSAHMKTAVFAAQCATVFANLHTELARCLVVEADVTSATMPRYVMVREDRPFCGFHVVFDVLIDFVARDHLMARMAGVKLSDRHVIDWPKNLLLPYGRKYKHLLKWNLDAPNDCGGGGGGGGGGLPRVVPIDRSAAAIEALFPVRGMRVADEWHISVSLAPVGHDLQLMRADTVVDTVYVARDSLEYTQRSLYARICSKLKRRERASSSSQSSCSDFDHVRYETPCFASPSVARVVPRALIESFLTASALNGGGGGRAGDTTERYHLQEALEPYEQRVRVSARPLDVIIDDAMNDDDGDDDDDGHVNDDGDGNDAPFYPFVEEQLAFYEEAIKCSVNVDHSVWVGRIATDTLLLLDSCLRTPSERFFSDFADDGVDGGGGGGTGNGGGKRKRRGGGGRSTGVRRQMSGEDESSGAASSTTLDRNALAERMLDNAVRCGAYTSTLSTLMRYGKMSRTDACKYLIRRYPEDRAGVFVWTRLGITPALNVFLQKNFSRTDFVYLLLKTHLGNEAATQRLYQLVCNVFGETPPVCNVFARDVYIMKVAGSTVSYFTGRKMTIDRDCKLRKFVMLVDDVEIASSHVEIECAYSYRTNYGIFNPVTGVFESNGPSLNELVYREMDPALMERGQLLHFKPALFRFGLDCFLKAPAYIRHVEATVPVMVLLSPLWPVYTQYPDFGRYQTMPIRDFAIVEFQTLLADLNRALRYPWPEDLCDRVAAIARTTELGALIVNCLGALYTLARYVTIDPQDVVQIIVSLFGRAPHSYIGIPEWETDDEHNLILKAPPSTGGENDGDVLCGGGGGGSSGGGGGGGNRCDYDGNDDVFHESFRRVLLTRLEAAENKFSIMRQMNETLADETDSLPMATTLTFKSLNAQTSVDMTALFRKIGFRLETNDNQYGGATAAAAAAAADRMDLSRYEYVQCAVLLAAWFTRMGERHALNDSPLFAYVNAKRTTLYAQLVKLAHGMADATVARDHGELTDHFLAFVESNECDARDAIHYPATFDVDAMRRLHAESATNARLMGDAAAAALIASPSARERRAIASAVVHLLRSGSFQYDYFVEFCKIIANLEYLGNRLRLGYNIYGTSSSGKSFFAELLDRVFASGSNSILSSRTFHDNRPTDNDMNAILLGTNFLVRLNEDDELLVDAFKKYVDFNYLSTRDMQKNLSTKYAIRAKVFFMSNHYVQVNKPFDCGFHNKYYPLFFNFDFVNLHARLDRLMEHRSALKLYTTKYLGGQILIQRYPAGSIDSLDAEVTVLSRQFLTRFFFFDTVTPVTAKKTGLVAHLHSRYFCITNPIQFFHDTVEIRPTNRGLEESRVRQILFNWWEKHKGNFARIKHFSNIADTIVNHLGRYRVGKRYNLEFIMSK